ncbi:MAG: thiamine diphosphokinase [Bacteroidota bacterium]
MKTKNKQALIICNGEMPSKKILAPLLQQKPFIVCADGGANKARSFGITPHVIIGDLDSISDKTRHYFSTVPIIHLSDQNSTDLEKALEYLLTNNYSGAAVVGATGDRPDHTLSNFSILLKYHKRLTLLYIDERCTIEVINKKVRFAAQIGQQISLVPMGRCTGVLTAGLKYPLKRESLEPGVREGTSNEAVKTNVTISLQKGPLLLFKIHPSITT